MYSLLLAIIYLSFISLGLPDSLIGSAWPIMHADLSVSMSSAGIITIIISVGTIISSFFSNSLTNKLGTGLVTAISVTLTALGLLGFSFAKAFWMLCVFAIPYGLGAGAVDAALNNYVALNYPARHLSWLHCMWGVGASISPYIMSFALTGGLGWPSGFRIVFYIQIALSALLFFTLPIWKKGSGKKSSYLQKNIDRLSETQLSEQKDTSKVSTLSVFRIKGIFLVLIAFFAYCAMEQTAGLWATSYLVEYKGIDATVAAKFASFFYIGITAGRALSGFFADKAGGQNAHTTWHDNHFGRNFASCDSRKRSRAVACRTHCHRARLCADLSCDNPLYAVQFRQREFASNYRSANGFCIYRDYGDASAFRRNCSKRFNRTLLGLFADICGFDARYVRDSQCEDEAQVFHSLRRV